MATTFDELIEELARQQNPQADQYLAQLADPQPAPTTAPMPMPVRQPAPEPEPPMPERRDVGPTTAESIGLAVSSLGEGFKGLANRLGNRPQQGSRHAAFRQAVAQDVAGRQRQANQEYSDSMQQRAQAVAKALQQKKMAAEQAMRDPNSPESERAWRVVNSMRTEAGLAPLDESQRGGFVAADAKTWLANAPQAMASQLQRQQAMEGDVRKQATDAASARAQLDALQAAGVDLTGIDTTDPVAVDKIFQLKRDELQGERALQRARVMAPRGEGGTSAALPPGTASAAEMMSRPESIQDALTDIDRKMDALGTGKGDEALYKRLQQRRDKLVEMDQYTLPGMRFTKTPTKSGHEQANNLMTVRNDMQRIVSAAKDANIEGVDRAVLAKVGEYTGAVTPDWLKEQFPQLQDAEDLARRLGRLKQVIASSIIVKKNEAELGAITGADMGLVHDMLGNPTGFLELASGRGIQSLESAFNDIESSYGDKMSQYGYAPVEAKQPGGAGRPSGGQAPPQQSPGGGLTPEEQAELEELERLEAEGKL